MINETDYNLSGKYNILSQQLTKYAGTCLYVFCLVGTLLNILTFSQRTYIRRACSIYLLVASACDFLHLNLGLLSNILQHGFHYDWTLTSIAYCKIKTYLVYVLTITSGTLTALAIITRYMLSSRKPSRWNYASRSVGIRFISIAIIFWIIISIPILFVSQRHFHPSANEQIICSNVCQHFSCIVVQIIYICLLNGLVPPFMMLVFGVLTCRNTRRLQQRSCVRSIRIQQINDQLTMMLIIQAIKSTFTSVPYSIFNCYWIIITRKHKLLIEEAKENLFNEIVHLLFWSNYSSFLIYMCSSDIFRSECIKAIKKIICCRWRKKYHYAGIRIDKTFS